MKELFTTDARILCAETRRNKKGKYKLHVVMIAETLDVRYRFKTFGVAYDMRDWSDKDEVRWIAEMVGVRNLRIPSEQLKGKEIKAIVERTKGNEFEPRALGYIDKDSFFIINGNGKKMSEKNTMKKLV